MLLGQLEMKLYICNSMIRLFNEFVKENPEIWNEKLKKEIYEACRTIISHEDSFINLAFEMGPIKWSYI